MVLRPPSRLLLLVAALLLPALIPAVLAAPRLPRVVEVPLRPAFVRLPGAAEMPARAGQVLAPDTLLRTQTPGRLQVQLADGRSFRLGGDAVLHLRGSVLDLQRGQIIAWVLPGQKGRAGAPLQVRTRVGTASIEGTTLFIDAGAEQLRVFSWEGQVQVTTSDGQRYRLSSGEQLTYRALAGPQGPAGWQPPQLLPRPELLARRASSPLLNGFTAPLDTWPTIRRELDLPR